MSGLLSLLLQVGVILALARVTGYVFRRLRQPQVMGEMVAGVLLGPSLLGWMIPGLSQVLFPADSLGSLNALSQFGLLLFMFLVGLELDGKILRGRTHAALAVSIASIIAPFILGALLALWLFPSYAGEGVSPIHFVLFIATAMSITAFPVLARILTERNLLRTSLGAIAVTSAAVNDVAGWMILAVVVVLVRATAETIPFWLTVAGLVGYLLVMFIPARRVLHRLDRYSQQKGYLTTAPLLEWIYFSRLIPKSYLPVPPEAAYETVIPQDSILEEILAEDNGSEKL